MKHPEMSALLLSGLLALGVAGCSVTREQSTVGQYVDDATVTARVKAKFAEDPTVTSPKARSPPKRIVFVAVVPLTGHTHAGPL